MPPVEEGAAASAQHARLLDHRDAPPLLPQQQGHRAPAESSPDHHRMFHRQSSLNAPTIANSHEGAFIKSGLKE
jgi:hypothetical protein